MWRYIENDLGKTRGWLARCDAQIMGNLLDCQTQSGVAGSVVEIGYIMANHLSPQLWRMTE